MDSAFKSGASATPPAAPASPSIGHPTAGDAGAGVPPTKPGAHWYYMVTQELRNVVVAAGLTPSHAVVNQVLTALQVLFAQTSALFGVSQSLQSVTRTLGVTYYNNTGRPITCLGLFSSAGNNVSAGVSLSINGGGAVIVGQCGGTAVNQCTGNFAVPIPVGASYRFDSGSVATFAVAEIR